MTGTHAVNKEYVDDAIQAIAGGTVVEVGRTIDVYVSVDGDDQTGDGSEAAPWKRLSSVAQYLTTFSRVDGTIRVNIGEGDFGTATVTKVKGTGNVYFKGAGSALTSIKSISVAGSGIKGETAKGIVDKLAIRNQGVSVVVASYAAYVCLGTLDYYDKPSNKTDIVLDIQAGGPDWIMINYGSTLRCAPNGGTIECRQHGIGGWGILGIGQYGGDRNTVIDGASWKFTGDVPNNFSWAFIFMWNSDYIADYYSGPFIQDMPPNCSKFIGYDRSVFKTNGKQGAAPAAPGGLDFFPGSYVGTLDATSTYDGIFGGTRRVLTAAQTYYVDALGNDRFNGSQTKPWLTLARAFNYLMKEVDLNGQTVTINVGAGRFIGSSLFDTVGSGTINIFGAGSALTIIAPEIGGWSRGACLGIGAGKAKIYVDGFSFEMATNWYAIYTSGAYNLYMQRSNYTADLVFIAPAGRTYGSYYLNNSKFSTSNTNGTLIEVRAGSQIDTIFDVNGGTTYDGATYTFTGIPAIGIMMKANNRATLSRDTGNVGGDITGIGKQYSLSNYTYFNVYNGAFYPGPAGTVDASCMVNGVMGPPAEFDETSIIENYEIKIAKRDEELIAMGIPLWTPEPPPPLYPTPEEYEARMTEFVEKSRTE